MDKKQTVPWHTKLLEVLASFPHREQLETLGHLVADIYTNQGLPISIGLKKTTDKHKLSRDEAIVVFFYAQARLVKHRRNSGIAEDKLEKLREHNRKQMQAFILTGEYDEL